MLLTTDHTSNRGRTRVGMAETGNRHKPPLPEPEPAATRRERNHQPWNTPISFF